MQEVVVWVLVILVGGGYGPQPAIIDNISSAKVCEALKAQVQRDLDESKFSGSSYGAQCYPVRKLRPA